MREIKFRAFDKVTKQMSPEFVLFGEFTLMGAIHSWQHHCGNHAKTSLEALDDLEVMQFTGLLDKNGKEIYEGDVIQYKSYHAFRRWWSTIEDIPLIDQEVQKQRDEVIVTKSVMRFNDGAFHIDHPVTAQDIAKGSRFQKSDSNNGEIEYKYWDFEVIGNIYEHKHLLE